MLKSIVKAALIIIGLSSAGYAAGGGRWGPRPVPPVVLSAMVDFKENLMVISGHHFGTTPPTVTLAHQALKVKSCSKDRVVVDLPVGVEPATYRLTVTTNGPHRLTSSTFSAAIFALAGR
ncbi:MAG: hypothetical protein ACT4QB_01215 [Gammaproteobacteria bacterium]